MMNRTRELIFKISFLLLGVAVVCFFGLNTAAAANNSTIYVSIQGNNNWNGQYANFTNGTNGPKATIKNATGTVTSGGTVYIANGTYNENNIAITKNMSIIGTNQNNTIIDGTSTWNNIWYCLRGKFNYH